MLVDRATIQIRSGKGGDGAVAFRREKYIAKGGPKGGDGGKGGDVVLCASAEVDTLLDFAGRHHWHAENGGPGGDKQKHGADGEDLIIDLPPGTLVYDDDTGELLGDLDELGKTMLIAPGGRGGFGNEHFKTPTHQAPREFTPGEPSVEFNIRLELKVIADVGLVGMPNAGKSTLLSVISEARPKVANYPFTTLEPNLGIAELAGRSTTGYARRLVIADIPGLIEGAHEGHGLGHEFLRHVERTRVLIHLIEIEPADDSDPVENYRTIRNELGSYSPAMLDKPEIVALSKMDLLATDEDRMAAIQLIHEELNCPVVAISSASGVGLPELLEEAWRAAKKEASPATVTSGWGPRAAAAADEKTVADQDSDAK